MYTIIFLFIKKSNFTKQEGKLSNLITCTALFASFACTLATTGLIAYRMYSVFGEVYGRSRERFKHILDVLVQSAAVYALTSLLQAIIYVVAVTSPANAPAVVIVVENYSTTLFAIISVCIRTQYIMGFIKNRRAWHRPLWLLELPSYLRIKKSRPPLSYQTFNLKNDTLSIRLRVLWILLLPNRLALG